MSEPRPPRRPRYPGKNPRHFHEKYKEHQPGRYAADVARVIAAGKTPAGTHRPIMVAEVLAALRPAAGEIAVDCTLGHGGHAAALLAAVGPGGRLIGLDADPVELPRAEARLRAAAGVPPGALVVRRTNFAALPAVLAADAPGGADVILADLGVSSMQIDDPSRGFTFKADGPLDMRMNPGRGRPASELLSTLDRGSLARLLGENADEPDAARVSSAILSAHARSPLVTTLALAEAVRAGVPPGAADAAVRRAFQALRIAVNDELGALDAWLRVLPACLRPGGRVAVLSFHSGEDRRVKAAFRDGLRAGVYASVSDEPARPSAAERRDNPRSAPAKLRAAVRS